MLTLQFLFRQFLPRLTSYSEAKKYLLDSIKDLAAIPRRLEARYPGISQIGVAGRDETNLLFDLVSPYLLHVMIGLKTRDAIENKKNHEKLHTLEIPYNNVGVRFPDFMSIPRFVSAERYSVNKCLPRIKRSLEEKIGFIEGTDIVKGKGLEEPVKRLRDFFFNNDFFCKENDKTGRSSEK